MKVDIWSEKYRPQTLEDYVWRDPQMKSKIEEWISHGAVPHLLLSGKSGLGKSSLAFLILKCLNVPEEDICKINSSSKYRTADKLENRIEGFCNTYPMIDNEHQIKYVLLEEADNLSKLSQGFLRNEMEKNVDHIRFIFTCNYRERIDPAIIGRFQEFNFQAIDQEEFIKRILSILDSEKVEYDIETLLPFIDNTYPDLRKCIGIVQQSVINNKLFPFSSNDGKAFDYITDAIDCYKKGLYKKAREMIISQATVEEYPDIYRFMYRNLELWGDKEDEALLLIRDGVYKDGIVCDREINLAATLLELSRLKEKI